MTKQICISAGNEDDVTTSACKPRNAKPEGVWYEQEFTGSKTRWLAFLGYLVCLLPILVILCIPIHKRSVYLACLGLVGLLMILVPLIIISWIPMDKRFVYLEPHCGRLFDVDGNELPKEGKPLYPVPTGYNPMNIINLRRGRLVGMNEKVPQATNHVEPFFVEEEPLKDAPTHKFFSGCPNAPVPAKDII